MARKPEMTAEEAVNYIMSSLVINQDATLGNILRNAVPDDLLNALPEAKEKNDVIRTALTRIITPMRLMREDHFPGKNKELFHAELKLRLQKSVGNMASALPEQLMFN